MAGGYVRGLRAPLGKAVSDTRRLFPRPDTRPPDLGRRRPRMRAVVIGAGVNELVAAHYLARAGHRVLVFEGRATAPATGMQGGWIPPRIARELALEAHGLEVRLPDPWISTPLPGGGRLELSRDMARSV